MREEWVGVHGYEGLYEVSNLGRVRSNDHVISRYMRVRSGHVKQVWQRVTGKVLKPCGLVYDIVGLCKDGRSTTRYVHELVAYSFIGPRPAMMQICHNDGDHRNNHVSNLRYDTPSNNSLDRNKHGTGAIGSFNPRAILNESQVKDIKVLLTHHTPKEIGKIYGRPTSTIKSIKNGRNWKHV